MTRALSAIVPAAAFAGAPLVARAMAQELYPTRPVTLLVPFPPGGIADLTARPLAAALERVLKRA